MSLGQKHRKFFGVWQDDGYENVPSLAEVMDKNWLPAEFEKIVTYLLTCPLVSVIPTAETCILCDAQVAPYGWFSDGVWLWKTSLAHYVQEHHVVIPKLMHSHFTARDFLIPQYEFNHDELDWPFGGPYSSA